MKTILFTIYSFLAIATTLNAQQLGIIFSAPTGQGVVMSGGTKMFDVSMDANGDGKNELVTMDRDNSFFYNKIAFADIFDNDGQNQQIIIQLPTGLIAQIDGIIAVGFPNLLSTGFDATTGIKPLLLANRKQQIFEGILEEGTVEYLSGVVAFNKKYRLVNVKDYDGDGLHEILLYDRDSKQLEMWGEQ